MARSLSVKPAVKIAEQKKNNKVFDHNHHSNEHLSEAINLRKDKNKTRSLPKKPAVQPAEPKIPDCVVNRNP